MSERELLLQLADDELVVGWRDSEWTGIAPFLEEDVALSSIAQNEIGHARAIYELLAEDADELAFDREPEEYVCAPLVELRLVPDWARTIARRVLYEAADELRLEQLKASSDPDVAGLAAKIDREEAYHRMHAQMWADRLRANRATGRPSTSSSRRRSHCSTRTFDRRSRLASTESSQVTSCYKVMSEGATSTSGRRCGTR